MDGALSRLERLCPLSGCYLADWRGDTAGMPGERIPLKVAPIDLNAVVRRSCRDHTGQIGLTERFSGVEDDAGEGLSAAGWSLQRSG